MSQKPEVIFKYIFPYNYNPVYVNGAHGGVSPRGELIANFFLERMPLPNSISNELTPNGLIGKETGTEPEDLSSSIVRYVSTGIVMNYDSARNLHAWLTDKIKEMEFLMQARQDMAAGQADDKGGH